jgi:serine/threonine protein phosphatase PrpC
VGRPGAAAGPSSPSGVIASPDQAAKAHELHADEDVVTALLRSRLMQARRKRGTAPATGGGSGAGSLGGGGGSGAGLLSGGSPGAALFAEPPGPARAGGVWAEGLRRADPPSPAALAAAERAASRGASPARPRTGSVGGTVTPPPTAPPASGERDAAGAASSSSSSATPSAAYAGPKLSAAQFLKLSKAAAGTPSPQQQSAAASGATATAAARGSRSRSPGVRKTTGASPVPVALPPTTPAGAQDIIARLRARYGYGSLLESLTTNALGTLAEPAEDVTSASSSTTSSSSGAQQQRQQPQQAAYPPSAAFAVGAGEAAAAPSFSPGGPADTSAAFMPITPFGKAAMLYKQFQQKGGDGGGSDAAGVKPQPQPQPQQQAPAPTSSTASFPPPAAADADVKRGPSRRPPPPPAPALGGAAPVLSFTPAKARAVAPPPPPSEYTLSSSSSAPAPAPVAAPQLPQAQAQAQPFTTHTAPHPQSSTASTQLESPRPAPLPTRPPTPPRPSTPPLPPMPAGAPAPAALPAPAPPSPSPSPSPPAPAPAPAAPRSVNVIKSYAGICEQGYSPHNLEKPCQDAIVMVEHPESDSVMLAVFDGHGEDGHFIAQHFRDRLPDLVFGHKKFSTFLPLADNVPPPSDDPAEIEAAADRAQKQVFKTSVLPPLGEPRPRRDVAGALKAAILAVEKEVLARNDIDCGLAGSTGCVAIISGDHVTVANVGDSRAVLVRTAAADAGAGAGGTDGGPTLLRLVPAPLTIDHKPTMASETRRILLAGGRVHAIKYDDGVEGPMRVWCRDEDVPGLAMSRSLCDTVGKRAGIVSTPDIFTYSLADTDAFLIVASDGLWEFMGAREIADIVGQTAAEAQLQQLAYEAAVAQRAGDDDGGHGGVGGGGGDHLPPLAEPMQHMQLALDALAEASGARWQAREGVIDDISIILAEIGRLPAK